jgi:tetratricopeptide (TPR) repeat protein
LGRTIGKGRKSQYTKAEEYILQGIKIFNEVQLKPLASQGSLYLGELYNDNGQKEKALEALKKAEGMMQEMGMDYWLRRTQEVLERVQG